MTRPITRRDFPGNDGAWRTSVERRLTTLWTAVQRAKQLLFGVPLTVTDAAPRTTSSTGWVDLWLVAGPVQHSLLTAQLFMSVDVDATTAEVRLVDRATGDLIVGPVSADRDRLLSWDTSTIPAGTWVAYKVQAHVTSASGSVTVALGAVVGHE